MRKGGGSLGRSGCLGKRCSKCRAWGVKWGRKGGKGVTKGVKRKGRW